ncbi:MAG: 23S rRNA (guanosine(2251)-2'-O)-methyltransferase RlmB [Puniceicoccales bacterium]|nr:23S rRNA (guanosine(2251)-2'-O)-methyltransferase RlmB [Puniceicoccales bacterium]
MPFPLARDNKHTDPQRPITKYSEDDLESLLEGLKDPLILVLDGLQDPHNLGACLRTADCAGVDLIIITKKHSAPVNETVKRIACGGAENVKILLANNLRNTLDKLKKLGVWIAGTSDHKSSQSLYQANLRGPLALVMGAEGDGIRHLTGVTCDFLLMIPMHGVVPCLNVSVATGVCLFEAVRQRRFAKKQKAEG